MSPQERFVEAFNEIAKEAHANARAKGFYENPPTPLERVALVHEELGECSSAFRHGNPPDDHIPEFSGAEAELADAIVRIMDMAVYLNLDVARALVAKMVYNATRPHKHGKVS